MRLGYIKPGAIYRYSNVMASDIVGWTEPQPAIGTELRFLQLIIDTTAPVTWARFSFVDDEVHNISFMYTYDQPEPDWSQYFEYVCMWWDLPTKR